MKQMVRAYQKARVPLQKPSQGISVRSRTTGQWGGSRASRRTGWKSGLEAGDSTCVQTRSYLGRAHPREVKGVGAVGETLKWEGIRRRWCLEVKAGATVCLQMPGCCEGAPRSKAGRGVSSAGCHDRVRPRSPRRKPKLSQLRRSPVGSRGARCGAREVRVGLLKSFQCKSRVNSRTRPS